MMSIVIFLKLVEPTSFVFGCINEVESVVRHIIGHISDKEEGPDCRINDWIVKYDQFLHDSFNWKVVYYEEQRNWKNQSISKLV